MIRLINVNKTYRANRVRKKVLDDVSAVFDTRHAYGILGLNGAGKSTLMRIIAGTELPDRGASIAGLRCRGRSPSTPDSIPA